MSCLSTFIITMAKITKLRQQWQISHSGVIRTHATAFRSRHKKQSSSEDDWWRKVALFFCPINASFSHDVTAAIGARNNETAAMLVYRKNPVSI